MENNFFRRIPTDLDLNGPVLEYTTQPSDASGDKDASVTFTVAAQALFPGDSGAEDGGTITYQWFEVGVGALSNGGQFSGVTTVTLTVSDLRTPQDQGRKFYCEVSYSPNNEYGTTGSGTGTAVNQPLKSNEATVSVNPELEIIAQPTDRTVGENVTATFSINAGLTDDTYLSDGAVIYQWYVGVGNATPILVSDGTVRTQNIVEIVVDETVFHTESQSFSSDGTVNIPPTGYDVSFTIAGGAGGSGGDDAGGPGGSSGSGRVGTFTVPNPTAQGQSLTFRVGSQGGGGGRGNFPSYGGPGGSNIASGGRGGGAGPRGWSGGGGGGGGASGVVRGDGILLAVVGGGGGGGGGSHNSGRAPGGGHGLGVEGSPYTSTINTASGGQGGDQGDDGGGGGGAGGGVAPARGGGGAGRDNTSPGRGGDGGRSGYRSDYINFIPPGGSNGGGGYASIDYKYTSTTQTASTDIIYQNTTISGQGTNTLTITSDESSFNAVRKVYCVVSHVTATNSALTSDTVTAAVVDNAAANNIVIETISADNTANIQTANLSNGDQEFQAGSVSVDTGAGANLYSFYSPDKDINVEIDLYGGKGADNSGYSGGEGGFSRIRFTMEQNVEYILAGMTDSVQTPYLYRKASLIANVGKGGDAGNRGRGGFGGGVSNNGEKAPGRDGGQGGSTSTTLSTTGVFGSVTSKTAVSPDTKATTPNAGRTVTCPRGVYWRNQGVSACSDVGTVKFRTSDGTEISNTASIERGYKAGYSLIETAGRRGTSTSGNGGNGSRGGAGGSNGYGGGGAAGYTSGVVTVVSTQLGGSTFDDARAILRVVT